MPSPTTSMVHVSRPLTNVSIAYVQSQDDYIADSVFPVVGVKNPVDKFFTFDKSDFFRDEAQLRAPGSESAGGGWDMSTASFDALRYSYHKDVDDETKDRSDAPLNLETMAAKWVTQKMLIKRERLFGSKFFATGIWTSEVDGVSSGPGAGEVLQWNDAASTPISDIKTAKSTVKKLTGFMPNVLALNNDGWDALSEHSDFLEKIKYTQVGIVSTGLVASALELEEIHVGKAVYETAAKGATSSMDWILGKHALLAYKTKAPALEEPSAGYTFSYSKFDKIKTKGGSAIKRIRIEPIESWRIEGDMYFDQKVVAVDCGYFFNGVVA